MGFFDFLFSRKKECKVRILEPKSLLCRYHKGGHDNVSVKYYNKIQNRTYFRKDLTSELNGRRVNHWKLVKITGSESSHDEFIPIFHGFKGKRRIRRKIHGRRR